MEQNNENGLTSEQQQRFESDLAWLARHKKWSKDDEAGVRRNVDRFGKPAVRFWWCLAKAKQAGYRFDAQSGYESLQDFCARVGMPGPVGRNSR